MYWSDAVCCISPSSSYWGMVGITWKPCSIAHSLWVFTTLTNPPMKSVNQLVSQTDKTSASCHGDLVVQTVLPSLHDKTHTQMVIIQYLGGKKNRWAYWSTCFFPQWFSHTEMATKTELLLSHTRHCLVPLVASIIYLSQLIQNVPLRKAYPSKITITQVFTNNIRIKEPICDYQAEYVSVSSPHSVTAKGVILYQWIISSPSIIQLSRKGLLWDLWWITHCTDLLL